MLSGILASVVVVMVMMVVSVDREGSSLRRRCKRELGSGRSGIHRIRASRQRWIAEGRRNVDGSWRSLAP